MEELIFFGVIILFSIIDSISRSRKKKRQGGSLPDGESSPAPEWELDDADLSTYDEEPSYDDAYAARGQMQDYTPTSPYGSRGSPGRSEPRSAEGMIPGDIWEEIAGLARGGTAPPEPPPLPVEVEPVRVHRVHRSHAGYGTDPSTRLRSEQDGLDPLRKSLSRDARAVRRQLGSHKRSALRRAVILREILGPPAASRQERFLDPLGD